MRRRLPFVILAVACMTTLTLSWNPVVKRSSGSLRWDVSSPIEWHPDGGSLGQLANGDAVSEVDAAFGIWAGVATSVIDYTQGAQIVDGLGTPVDVTSANYQAVIDLDNGQNPIIFDNDREIFDLLGLPNGVLGIAGALRTSGDTITKGYAIIEGDWYDGDPDDVGETTLDGLRATMLHEFGHLNGLGHTTVNRHQSMGLPGCPAPTAIYFATMNPFSHNDALTLSHDDEIGISSLYPTANFLTTDFGGIAGRVIQFDGTNGFDGANVVVRPDTTDCDDLYGLAQASQSGVNPAEDGGSGSYYFRGLPAATDWTIFVGNVSGGGGYPIGGLSPPQLPGPEEFWNGVNEDHLDPPDDPAQRTAITVQSAGAPVAGIDVLINVFDGPGALIEPSLTVAKSNGDKPGDPVALVLDDGGAETIFGASGTDQLAWINRFSPGQSELPFRLEQIDVLFFGLGGLLSAGRDLELLVYVDEAGTGDPANAVLMHSEPVTIEQVNAFNQYVLSSPVTVTGGDFYAGFYDLVADVADAPLGVADSTTQGGTSFIAFLSGSATPAPGDFSAVTDVGLSDRTWMIRARGSMLLPPGTVMLEWGESCNEGTVPGQDYAVYEGNIASLSGVQDHAPIACGTGGERKLTLPPDEETRFWLIAPLIVGIEGSQGSGTTVPRVPVSTCAPVDAGTCPD